MISRIKISVTPCLWVQSQKQFKKFPYLRIDANLARTHERRRMTKGYKKKAAARETAMTKREGIKAWGVLELDCPTEEEPPCEIDACIPVASNLGLGVSLCLQNKCMVSSVLDSNRQRHARKQIPTCSLI